MYHCHNEKGKTKSKVCGNDALLVGYIYLVSCVNCDLVHGINEALIPVA